MHEYNAINDDYEHPPESAQEIDPLSLELARLDRMFARHLATLRRSGRSTLGDAVGGAVIEDGEAEGLLHGLFTSHTRVLKENPIHEDWISPLEGLERARGVYGLASIERDLLLLTLSVEIDSRYARLVAYLNDHVGMTRPTVGLATALLAPDDDQARSRFMQRLIGDGPLRSFGLVALEGDGPVATRALISPGHFWPRLVDYQSVPRYVPSSRLPGASEYVFSRQTEARLVELADWIRCQSRSDMLIIVAGAPGCGRDFVAKVLARQCAESWLVVDAKHAVEIDTAQELAREAAWHDAALIVSNAEQLDAETYRHLQSRCTSPIVLITDADHDGQLLEAATRKCTEIALPTLGITERTELWAGMARRHAVSIDAGHLAGRFSFGPGRIDQVLRLAATSSRGDSDDSEVDAICHRLQKAQFRGLAQKLPCPFEPQDIVLPDKTRRELDLICTWANFGPALFSEGGAGSALHTGQGLVCLFSGPPGTGKTMAAQVIARRLGFDIYRIDLSQVVNKYVGETEKNLSQVFDEAQRSKVVLLFDEAETLFGDRSEVRTAQDRFANIEIGYLLQRIETFQGVAILATNLKKNMDEAFLRRLSVNAEFQIPGAEERQEIWTRLLPSLDQCAEDIDVDLLSRQFNIAGGDIRNAIFSALLLAAEESAALSMKHLARGLWRELQKSGRVVDTSQFGQWRAHVEPPAA